MSETNKSEKGMGFIIGASSVGTLIEWYDFYIFGMLATILSKQFFPEDSGTSALLSTLAIFAAGFIVRPFGALVFGRLGDMIGRKHTFLLTLVLMGGSTFAIGLVPGFKTIGWAAPILVLLLRLLQGLALGGEYGGAATYVAEHAPAHRRGYWTSWIQTTATLGLPGCATNSRRRAGSPSRRPSPRGSPPSSAPIRPSGARSNSTSSTWSKTIFQQRLTTDNTDDTDE